MTRSPSRPGYFRPLVLVPLGALMIGFTIAAFVAFGWQIGLFPACVTALAFGLWAWGERDLRRAETGLGLGEPITNPCRCNNPETSHQRGDQAFCRYRDDGP